MQMLEEMLTKQQVAKKHEVSTRTVDRWRSMGLLKAFKIGGTVRFRLDKLIEMEDRVMRVRAANSNHSLSC